VNLGSDFKKRVNVMLVGRLARPWRGN